MDLDCLYCTKCLRTTGNKTLPSRIVLQRYGRSSLIIGIFCELVHITSMLSFQELWCEMWAAHMTLEWMFFADMQHKSLMWAKRSCTISNWTKPSVAFLETDNIFISNFDSNLCLMIKSICTLLFLRLNRQVGRCVTFSCVRQELFACRNHNWAASNWTQPSAPLYIAPDFLVSDSKVFCCLVHTMDMFNSFCFRFEKRSAHRTLEYMLPLCMRLKRCGFRKGGCGPVRRTQPLPVPPTANNMLVSNFQIRFLLIHTGRGWRGCLVWDICMINLFDSIFEGRRALKRE